MALVLSRSPGETWGSDASESLAARIASGKGITLSVFRPGKGTAGQEQEDLGGQQKAFG